MAGARTRSIWAGIVAVPVALFLSAGVAHAGRAYIRAGNTLAGHVLTDKAGYVLMMFPREEHSLKLCIRIPSCMSDWPPVTTTGPPIAGPGIDRLPARRGALQREAARRHLCRLAAAHLQVRLQRAELRHEHWHQPVRRSVGRARSGRRVYQLIGWLDGEPGPHTEPHDSQKQAEPTSGRTCSATSLARASIGPEIGPELRKYELT